MKILLIEADKSLCDSLNTLLTAKGFQMETICDGEAGADYAVTGFYDLLILDVAVPGLNAHQVARQVRSQRCAVPMLMLCENAGAEERIQGMNAGADYCLARSVDSRELLACINALLRRQGKQEDRVAMGKTALDLSTAMLSCGDKSVRLSAKELEVMRYLLQSGRRNLSKEVLLGRVWGYGSNAVENHVEVYIGFLRKKLQAIDSDIRIESVRRMGYHLEADE